MKSDNEHIVSVVLEVRILVTPESEGGTRDFQSTGHTLFLDLGAGYTGVFTFKLHWTVYLRFVHFFVGKLYFSNIYIKNKANACLANVLRDD